MSIRVMTKVWDCEALTNQIELIALLALADFADDNGICYPSTKTLAHKARISMRTAQRVVVSLKQKGMLVIVEQGGPSKDGNHANRYRIVSEALHNATGEASAVTQGVTSDRRNGYVSVTQGVTSQLCHTNHHRETSKETRERAHVREGTQSPSAKTPRKEKESPFVTNPPTKPEVVAFALSKGISESDALELIEQWQEGNWRDLKGNVILSWKQKLLTFRDNRWLPSNKRSSNKNNEPMTRKQEERKINEYLNRF